MDRGGWWSSVLKAGDLDRPAVGDATRLLVAIAAVCFVAHMLVAGNYGEAGALSHLSAPGRLPPVISAHNNYYLWGPGTCTGNVLIVIGYSASDLEPVYSQVMLAATQECQYCNALEANLSVYVGSSPTNPDPTRLWPSAKHYD